MMRRSSQAALGPAPGSTRVAYCTAVVLAGVAALAPVLALAQPTTDPAAELQSILLSLAVVVGLIVAGAYIVKRTPLGHATRASGPLKVIASLPLGPKERLLLVDVHGTELLVAIGPSGTAIAATDGSSMSRAASTDDVVGAFSLGDSR